MNLRWLVLDIPDPLCKFSVILVNIVATLMALFLILWGLESMTVQTADAPKYHNITEHIFGVYFLVSGFLMISAVWSDNQDIFSLAVRLIGIVTGIVTQLIVASYAIGLFDMYNGVNELCVYACYATPIVSTALLRRLLPTLVAIRQHIRYRKGHCPQCAYDLRGYEHERCPECGKEIRQGNPA